MRRTARPQADPLAPHAAKLVAALNAPRSSPLLVDCARFFGDDLAVTNAVAVDVDSNGMTLSCTTSVAKGRDENGAVSERTTATQELRVPFSRPARTPREFNRAVAALTAEARKGLGPSASSLSRRSGPISRFFPNFPAAAVLLLGISLTLYLHWHPHPTPIPWPLVAALRDFLPPVIVKVASYLILVLHGLEATLAVLCARAKGCSWNCTLAWAIAVAVFGYGSLSRLVNEE